MYEYPGGGQNLANKILENHPELTTPDLEHTSLTESFDAAPNCSFINPSVKQGHWGLAETLAETKVNLVNLTVYESTRKSKEVLSRSIQGCFSSASNFIIYYSPKGTKAISPLDVKILDPMITFGAIGDTTKTAMEGWERFVAEKPNAKSLREAMTGLF